MGEAVLNTHDEIGEIRLSLPNKHYYLVNLAPFGLENDNEVFLPVDEPHGLIEATLKRQ
jgi:urate oxidase